MWLAPQQAVVINITDAQGEYCQGVQSRLEQMGYRAIADLRNEKIGFKIREHTLARVPFILVVGDRELQDGTGAVRTREGKDLGSMSLEDFADLMNKAIALKGRTSDLGELVAEAC